MFIWNAACVVHGTTSFTIISMLLLNKEIDDTDDSSNIDRAKEMIIN